MKKFNGYWVSIVVVLVTAILGLSLLTGSILLVIPGFALAALAVLLHQTKRLVDWVSDKFMDTAETTLDGAAYFAANAYSAGAGTGATIPGKDRGDGHREVAVVGSREGDAVSGLVYKALVNEDGHEVSWTEPVPAPEPAPERNTTEVVA